jgi:RNA methyltransferase, TrmH family
MASETTDQAAAERFLRAVGLSLGGLGGAGVRVLAAGWPELAAVAALAPDPEGRADMRALVAASGERGLREVLLALPRGSRVLVEVAGAWALETVADVLEGEVLPPSQGVARFLGVRRPARRGRAPGPDRTLARGDPEVELFRELAQPAGRRGRGQFVAEGSTLVRRALDDGLPVASVVHTADLARSPEGPALLDLARAEGIPGLRASDGLLGTLTPTRPLPSVLAAVHLRLREAASLHAGPAAALLVAESLQNPDNLGLALRTADAAGAEAVVVAGEGADPLHRNCVRAARGAVGRLPLFTCADLPAWLRGLRRAGFQVVASTAHAERSLFEAPLRPPLCVVVGNEERGLSAGALEAAGERLRIPMAPGQSSHNVAVAAGILLYELRRPRS